MKKLRIIVTSVIVLAIIGGAFAFKTKCGSFCVLTGTTSGDCTTFKQGFKITTGGLGSADYRYYPCWDDDDRTGCTAANNGKCTAQFKLIAD